MLERWTLAMVRHRFAVLLIWFIVIIVGFGVSVNLQDRLTTSLVVPGSPSAQADQILGQRFDDNIEGTFTVVYKFDNASATEIEHFKSQILVATAVIPSAKITQQKAIDGILFATVGTPFNLITAAQYTKAFRDALKVSGLTTALVTGPPAIKSDVTPVLSKDLHRGQGIALALALFLLILMLGFSWAVLIPFIFAAGSISFALTIIFLLSHTMLMVLYIPNIIELIGLGLAIDYSLLMVHRFRNEIGANEDVLTHVAVVRTMKTAGRTVILSGLSVSIGLATLLLVPVPFIRSLGIAGLVVPIVSSIAALTLQPALFSIVGKGGITSKTFSGLLSRKDPTSGVWAHIARVVVARPKSIFAFSILCLIVLSSSLFWLAITPSSLTAIPVNLESSQALSLATDRVGQGIITPFEIAIDLGQPHLARTPAIQKARDELTHWLLNDPEVFIVASDDKGAFVDSTGQYLRIFIIGRHDFASKFSKDFVTQLRARYLPQANFPSDSKVYLGGVPPQGVDLIATIVESIPWILSVILLLTYLILMRAFRSVLIPLKAIILNLFSISVAISCIVLVFHHSLGTSALGTFRLDQIEIWALVFLFAVLFGISMDYEIFIVSRIREARDRGASNNEAIVEGIAHTGGVVSAAALIFVAAVSGLIFGHFAGLQEIGIGLSSGVLIDATIIRGLLLPSTMVLLGRWNWWLPRPKAPLGMGEASPLQRRDEA